MLFFFIYDIFSHKCAVLFKPELKQLNKTLNYIYESFFSVLPDIHTALPDISAWCSALTILPKSSLDKKGTENWFRKQKSTHILGLVAL